jgi:tRNA-dihydrouridine synthase A
MTERLNKATGTHRVCVAPMMELTHRHCRYFHRLLSRHVWLYTEMVTTGALLHGDARQHLMFNEEEHPVALQLGGNMPEALAACAKLGEKAGYDEINLNCGCPSARVAQGAFGACLMADAARVADCVRAMRNAVSIPITIKHRIGLDPLDNYAFVRDFVGVNAEAGCQTFIVHARCALLQGLSPKENREIPPLNYEMVYRLKRDFPNLEIIVNGGIKTSTQIAHHLMHLDGVMLGREAYYNPWQLASIDHDFYGAQPKPLQRTQVIEAIKTYATRQLAAGTTLGAIARPLIGLYHGLPGARRWRRTLSNSRRLSEGDLNIFDEAY